MAEKLSIQIALEGGEVIARQLGDIGEAGTKAFAEIGKSAEQVGGFKQLKPEDVTAKLQEMGVTGVDAIKKIQDAVKSAGRLETLVAAISSVESGLAAMGRAAIPVGAAIAAAMVAATKATISFAGSITQVNEQAMRLGQGIEQFDRMRQALAGAGVSAQGVTSFMQQLGAAADKANLDRVAKAFKEVQEAMARGAGGGAIGQTAEWKTLQQEAMKATEAGKRAREMLEKMGDPIPRGAALTLEELIVKTGSVEAGLKAFVEQLRAMPAGAERNKVAMDALGISADKLLKAYDNLAAKGAGAITPDMVTKADEVTAAVNRLEDAWTRFGGLTFAPVVVAELNTITAAIQALQNLINNFSWGTFASAATSAGNALGWLTPAGLAAKALAAAFGGVAPAAAQAGAASAQAGQQAAQAGEQAASGFMVWDEKLGAITQKQAQAGAASAQAGQQAAQAGEQAASGFMVWDEKLGAITQKQAEVARSSTQAGTDAAQAGQTAASGWESFLAILDEVARKAGKILGGGGGGGGSATAPAMARGGLLGGRGTGTSDSNLAWLSRGEYIVPAWAVRQPGVLALLEALRRSGRIPGFADGGLAFSFVLPTDAEGNLNQLAEGLKQMWSQFVNSGDQAIGQMGEIITASVDTIKDAIDKLFAAAKKIAEAIDKIEGEIEGKAGGGLLRGRGTGTSDSNLAWVSRGEYITPAGAVRQPGVLAFLEALRRSGGNLGRVLDGMGRFALGGMVPHAIPAFAGGGLVGGMSNVTIQFPGLPPISGLRASSGVVDELQRAAALAQVRSGGRKPSRYS